MSEVPVGVAFGLCGEGAVETFEATEVEGNDFSDNIPVSEVPVASVFGLRSEGPVETLEAVEAVVA